MTKDILSRWETARETDHQTVRSCDVGADPHRLCRSGWARYDAQGIYICRACEFCEKVKLGGYRTKILTGYSQADVDEPIEPEDGGYDF